MFKEYLKKLRNDKGFTMIEMMVVLIIIAVLIAGGIRFYLGYIENAKVTKAKANITTMQGALDAYYSENAKYPGVGVSPAAEGDELLNAGIKPGSWNASGDAIEATDPWSENYTYECSGTPPNTYTIKSGYNKVQGETGKVVKGTGTDGESTSPTVAAATP